MLIWENHSNWLDHAIWLTLFDWRLVFSMSINVATRPRRKSTQTGASYPVPPRTPRQRLLRLEAVNWRGSDARLPGLLLRDASECWQFSRRCEDGLCMILFGCGCSGNCGVSYILKFFKIPILRVWRGETNLLLIETRWRFFAKCKHLSRCVGSEKLYWSPSISEKNMGVPMTMIHSVFWVKSLLGTQCGSIRSDCPEYRTAPVTQTPLWAVYRHSESSDDFG